MSPMARSLLGFTLVALVALSAVACNRVKVQDVQGPDGGEWVRISCKHMDQKCYRVAANMCPNGYYFADSAGPAPTRTRDIDAESAEGEGAASGTAPHPRAGVNAKTLPPQERWSSRMYSKRSGPPRVQGPTTTASN